MSMMNRPQSHDIQRLTKHIEAMVDRKINGRGVSKPSWDIRFGKVTATSPLTIQTADGSNFSTNIHHALGYTPTINDWVCFFESSEGTRWIVDKSV